MIKYITKCHTLIQILNRYIWCLLMIYVMGMLQLQSFHKSENSESTVFDFSAICETGMLSSTNITSLNTFRNSRKKTIQRPARKELVLNREFLKKKKIPHMQHLQHNVFAGI